MSRQLFTKPRAGKLSPTRKVPRDPHPLAAGKTADIKAGFDHFQRNRMTAPRVTTK